MLTITEMLRKHGVVGKFVEFYGPGVSALPLANRATIGNMSPEFGSTIAVFPIDEETIEYLKLTGRSEEQLALVEAYAKEQGLWHDPDAEPRYSEKLELDLATVVPSLAGPKRPQDRVSLSDAKDVVPRGARRLRRRRPSRRHDRRTTRRVAESFPASDPPAHSTGGNGDGAADDWRNHRGRQRRRAPDATRSRSPSTTAPSSSSTTARWRSPRSPRAPTPRTRR